MKIVFAGSPQYAVPSLTALFKDFGVAAVLTRPDRPFGRKRVLSPTPVKEEALKLNIPVYDFPKVGEHVKELSSIGADIMITCAYGQILTREVLDLFPCGVWNLHASLLPKFRGASPIQSAILAGESHTGVTVMRTEEALDSGDILLVKRLPIEDLTAGELSERLSKLSAEAAVEAVKLISSGDYSLLLQDNAKATYCKKISKENARLDFKKSAAEVLRSVKAFSPTPAAYCLFGGNILNILNCTLLTESAAAGEVFRCDKRGIAVGCGENSICITLLQPAGGKVMPAADFVNGRKIKAGDFLD